MDMKKIMILTVVLIIAVTSLSTVSAGLFDGLFGNSQNNIINIDDYQFNIPDGFELDNDSENYNYKAYWFLSAGGEYGFESDIEDGDLSEVPDGAEVFNQTHMRYVNSEGKNITINIYYPIGDFTHSDSDLTLNKTINDVEGQFDEEDGTVEFSFLKNKDIISIIAPDEDTLSNIIVNK